MSVTARGITKVHYTVNRQKGSERKGNFEGHMRRFASQIQEFQENVVSVVRSLSPFHGEFRRRFA